MVENARRIDMFVEHDTFITLPKEQALKLITDYQEALEKSEKEMSADVHKLFHGKRRTVTNFEYNNHVIIGLRIRD